jgi:PHD/YefM family antitoxin component YafN of YafNO toxin-antitoxin module
MSVIAMSEAKARLSSLVADPQFEDVVLLRHGKVAAVLINPGRYEELLEAVDELNYIGAAAHFREHPEPTMEAGEFLLDWRPTRPRDQAASSRPLALVGSSASNRQR